MVPSCSRVYCCLFVGLIVLLHHSPTADALKVRLEKGDEVGPKQLRGAASRADRESAYRAEGDCNYGPYDSKDCDRNIELYRKFVATHGDEVNTWPIVAADPKTTNKLAVVALPVLQSKYAPIEFVTRTLMRRLGPDWALQIFYIPPVDDQVRERLGNPKNVIFTPFTLHGQEITDGTAVTYGESNVFLVDPDDMWRHIDERHEHVLIYEEDTLLLKSKCVDKFLDYDYVGSPWANWIPNKMPRFLAHGREGGNGGFSIRSRKRNLEEAVKLQENPQKMFDPSTGGMFGAEDASMSMRLQRTDDAKLADLNTAKGFSVESIYDSSPCAIHKPWKYMTAKQFDSLLGVDEDFGKSVPDLASTISEKMN